MSSFPSKKITIVDIPGVKNATARFKYNFFSPDEMLNDSGIEKVSEKVKAGDTPTGQLQNFVERFSPRNVTITFSPPHVKNTQNEFITSEGSFSFGNEVGLENYINKIYSEESFSNSNFTVIDLQDNGIDGKLFEFVSGSIAAKIDQQNASLALKIADITGQTIGAISDSSFSLLDAAKTLYASTSDAVTGKFLVQSLNAIDFLGAKFVDETGKQNIISKTFDDIKGFHHHAQLNDRFIADIIDTVATDPTSIHADEAQSKLDALRKRQARAVTHAKINDVSLEEYDIAVTPISTRRVATERFQPRVVVVGYIADKWEEKEDGTLKSCRPIVINNPQAHAIFDTRIKYGKAYVYSVKAVALVETLVASYSSGFGVGASFLISSEPTRKMRVLCEENVPPPPPTDLTGIWDAVAETLTLNWSYPVNTQRDVKKFQVFRRNNVMSPFTLLREYDFDDSMIPFQNPENPQTVNVKKSTSPVTLHTDFGFTKDSTYIYSICAIDAHGLMSNYSAQIEISFERLKNSLKKRLISPSGAPKSYPNMYIPNELFEDVIRVSSKKKLHIHFTPEYLDVTGRAGTSMGLIASDKNGGKYRLQIINTDLQKATSVDIDVKNFRTDI